jgi:hypothetical protein
MRTRVRFPSTALPFHCNGFTLFNQLDGPGLFVLLQHEIEPEQETQQPEIGLDGRRETR